MSNSSGIIPVLILVALLILSAGCTAANRTAINKPVLFIVRLFKATTYYAPDVFLYYALIFLIPVGVGWYLDRAEPVAQPG